MGEITQTDFGYTFQRGLPGTGLMDYRARFYAPYLNRMTQPDSIVPEPGNPQALNRYSYALNNSIRYNDPTGHDPHWCTDASCRTDYYNSMMGLWRSAHHRDSGGGDGYNNGDVTSDGEKIREVTDLRELMEMCMQDPYASPDCLPLPKPADCTFSSELTIGPNPPAGCHIDHFETKYDLYLVDWWNVGVNVFSISGNLALAAGFFGMLGIGEVPAAGYYAVTQVVSIGYDVYTLNEGAITWEVVSFALNIEERIPGVSLVESLINLELERQHAQIQVPVYVSNIPERMFIPPFMYQTR